MKTIKLFAILALCVSVLPGCKEKEVFWLGADLGWITEYEAYGHKFYNADGEDMECTALMKEL